MKLTVCLIVYLLVFLVIRFVRLDKTSNRIILLFVGYWFIATVLSIFQVFGLSSVSDSTYSLVYIHLVSFTLGFLSVRINRRSCSFISRDIIDKQINALTKNPWFIGILIASIVYVVALYIVFLDLIVAMESMTEARGEYYEGEIYGPAFLIINQFFLQPLNTILLPIFAYKLYYKRDFIFWLITIFILVVASLAGGRITYVRIAIVVFCVIVCIFDSIKAKRKLLGAAALGIIGLYALLIFTSAARFGQFGLNKQTFDIGNAVAMEHLATYSAGPIAALDHSIKDDYLSQVGGYKYGRLTGTSIDRMTCMILRRFGINAVDAMDKVVKIKQDSWISIGDVTFNALYTSIFVYYLDFGIWGVIFIPILLGYLSRLFIKRMYKYESLPYLIIVSWFFFIMMKSVMDYAFYNPSDIILLLGLIWLGKKSKVKHKI